MSTISLPIELPADISDFQSLCSLIGFVEINWALFEQSMDCIVLTVHRDLGGSVLEKKLPKTYTAKSEFLKKAFSKVVVLNPFRNEAIELLGKSDELSKKRNDLTHGVVTHIEVREGIYNFSKIDYVGSEHSYRDFILDPKEFPTLAQDLVDIGAQVIRLGMKVNEVELRLSKLRNFN